MRHQPIATAPRPRCRGDLGQVGGIEVLPFGFLVFIAGTLLLANAWAVVDARLAVARAAREGTRAYVESDDAGAAAAAAVARAEETLEALGRNEDALVSSPEVDPHFARCRRVEMTVTARVPALVVPFIGGFGGPIDVRATHSELIDPFRDGLPGAAEC